jgi:hypothetical protein
VHRFFPADDPVGKRFCTDPDNKTYWYEIVGVVGDARRGGLERAVIPEFYGPLIPSAGGRVDLVVRTSGDPQALVSAVRAEIKRALPQIRVDNTSTAEIQLAAFTAQRRLQTWLLAGFALFAAILAGIGIFVSPTTRSPSARRKSASASRSGPLRSTCCASWSRIGLRMPLLGIAAGLAAAAALTRLIASQLYEITATDPVTFAGVAAILAGVAAAACVLAGWRAARANPIGALRRST